MRKYIFCEWLFLVQLWTVSNYYWSLKWSYDCDMAGGVCDLTWDSESFGLLNIIFNNGLYRRLAFVWHYAAQTEGPDTNCAVIDGSQFNIPIYYFSFSFSVCKKIICLLFCCYLGWIAITIACSQFLRFSWHVSLTDHLKLTNFAQVVIPPPMCQKTVNIDSPACDCSFEAYNGSILATLSNNRLLCVGK